MHSLGLMCWHPPMDEHEADSVGMETRTRCVCERRQGWEAPGIRWSLPWLPGAHEALQEKEKETYAT